MSAFRFIVEKIGAGAMGLIAGLVCTGIVAVAADALPFGSTIGMYSRFGTTDQKDAMYTGPSGQMLDTQTHDVFTGDKIDPDDSTESHVWLGQDDLVVGLANKASGGTVRWRMTARWRRCIRTCWMNCMGSGWGYRPGRSIRP